MSIRIRRFDYRPQYHALRHEILKAVQSVLESGVLINGPHGAAFEEEMANFLGVEGYGIAVGNGTDALAVALRAFNIGPGDEVVTVANTAVATVAAIRMVGATPVFCDVHPATLMMDPPDLERRLTLHTRAIIPVHLFGNAVDMVAIRDIAQRHGVRVIEDCAQSLGTTFCGRMTGTWGHVGCFSFYPTKNLGAYGDGGFCFTSDPRLAREIRQIRNYGCDGGPVARREGVNSRLDEIQAAILRVKLRHVSRWAAIRQQIACAYVEGLPGQCSVPATTPGAQHSYHLFVVQAPHRDDVMATLANQGIECGIHYPVPIHRMPAYRFLDCPAGSLPVTEAAAERVLSLPCYPELPMPAVARVCAALTNAIQVNSSPAVAMNSNGCTPEG